MKNAIDLKEEFESLIKNGNGNLAYDEWFKRIAELLMKNFIIETTNKKYKILEVEFYYYSNEHEDESTYGFMKNGIHKNKRIQEFKRKQCSPLTWFIHYSGIDLVIGTDSNPGGILIRTIRDKASEENIYTGPYISMLELINQGTKSDTGNFLLKLTPDPNLNNVNITVKSQKRKGIGKNAGKFGKENYNFYVE
jgi:hypothetical protein